MFVSAGHDAGNTTAGSVANPGRSNRSLDELEHRITNAMDKLERMVKEGMPRPNIDATMGFLGRLRARVDSLMCGATRVVAAGDADTDPAEVLRHKTRLSTRQAKRMAKVAKRLSEMPKVAESFAAGDINLEHASAFVNAAEKVGAAAVEADPDLLSLAESTRPDTFERRARDWGNRKLMEAGVDLLERQRQAREARLWMDRDSGMGMLLAKLPPLRFLQLQQVVDRRYLELLQWDSAGGTDPNEVRTPQQRLADVVFELLTNLDPVTGELIDRQVGPGVKPSTQMILTAPVGVVDGTNPDDHCEIVGVGPVPRRILETLSPDTELAGMIFDRSGRPLWLGRNQRLANVPQRLAVAIRDGGCFECGAPMHRCELHHIDEWHRDGGRTDIGNLVAVCRKHHKWLETENLVVRRTEDGYQAHPRDGPLP